MCTDVQEEFQQIHIRVNTYIKTKLQVKSNNLANLCPMHLKNIQCTIIKKAKVSVVYVEDKKLVNLNKQLFSGCISVEHSIPNHILVFATSIKTCNVMLHISS